MHTRTFDRIPQFRINLNLFFHFLLFGFGHAMEIRGKIIAYIIVNCIEDFIYRIAMTEGLLISLSILVFHHPQFFYPFIHRNRQHIHRNAACADAYAGHGGINLPLGPGIDRQCVIGFYSTVVYSCTDCVIECIDIHAYADTGQQSAGAGPGSVFYL